MLLGRFPGAGQLSLTALRPDAPHSGTEEEHPAMAEPDIVLRGDLGAILRFAAGKKNPDSLAEAEAPGQSARLAGRISEAVSRTAKNLRGGAYGGFATIVGCGDMIYQLFQYVPSGPPALAS